MSEKTEADRRREFIRPEKVLVDYTCVDGWHVFRSREVPGLCAGAVDLHLAHRAVASQLRELAEHCLGLTAVDFVPHASVDQFKAWIEASGKSPVPKIRTTAQAVWSMVPVS